MRRPQALLLPPPSGSGVLAEPLPPCSSPQAAVASGQQRLSMEHPSGSPCRVFSRHRLALWSPSGPVSTRQTVGPALGQQGNVVPTEQVRPTHRPAAAAAGSHLRTSRTGGTEKTPRS